MGNSRGTCAGLARSFALAAAVIVAQCTPPSPSAAGQTTAPALPLPELLLPDRAAGTRLQSPAALRLFFAALDRLDGGRSTRPLRILQLGDSHTAADAFSGRMREALQQRFGAAGRGWLPAGIPFQYFSPRLVTVAAKGWRQFGPAAAGELPLGLDAAVAASEERGAQMTLTSTEAEGFDGCAVEFLTAPQGVPLFVRVDGGPVQRISTAAPTIRARRVEIACGARSRRFELSVADSRPVRVVGWATERHTPGIVYENHGTIGARVGLLARMSRDTVMRELADDRPALIVVAFGTNEGFDDALDRHEYAAGFRDNLAMLHRLAPRAAILVVGPPDGNRLDKSCPRVGDPCAADAPVPADESCAWHEPPSLAAVRAIQKRIAAEKGWAFWDWSAAMGGICSMHRLVSREPPWASPDHVHLTRLGYAASADVLFFDLMSAYERSKAGGGAKQAARE